MAPVITLTTDFGRSDHYVAAVNGSIQSVNPQAVIVDICHEVRPQDAEHAAFLLACTYDIFPPGSIHVDIVGSGRGTRSATRWLWRPQAPCSSTATTAFLRPLSPSDHDKKLPRSLKGSRSPNPY
jgi:hypothetical protein